MQFTTAPHLKKRASADAIFLPFWQKGGVAKPAASLEEFEHATKLPIATKDFKAKSGEIVQIFEKSPLEKRVFLLGLGKEESLSPENLRVSYAEVTKLCAKKGITKVNLLLPHVADLRGITLDAALKAIGEGLLLTNYDWTHATNTEDKKTLLKEIAFIGVLPKALTLLEEIKQIAEGVHLARDLINGNADSITPAYLAQSSISLSKRFPSIKLTLFDKEKILDHGLRLIYAVGRGAMHDPYFIQMSYQGNPRSKDHTAIIGKGITFDTGGINLKPSGSIETMRDDMSGAATVLAVMGIIAALGLKVNVTGVIPTCENAIGSKSFKPGDVYKSYLGKTVEIKDTDAEGRLILADALSYSAKNLSCTRMIDFATLTGSVVVALGDDMAGLFSNDDKLAELLLSASHSTNEPLWRLPLYSPYKESLKSDIADLKNVGGRPGGSIKAALFLEEFVGAISWAHIDIAGPAFSNKERGYLPKNGVGFGVRLMIEFFKQLSK